MSEPEYMLFMYESLNEIYQGAADKINTIEELPLQIGLEMLSVMIRYACRPQNTAIIVLAREEIKKITLEWLVQHIPKAVQTSINLEDEWEYRRLLELLSEVAPQLLKEYTEKGLTSRNEEVKEAAEDFLFSVSEDSENSNS